jgi:hypothetical protein
MTGRKNATTTDSSAIGDKMQTRQTLTTHLRLTLVVVLAIMAAALLKADHGRISANAASAGQPLPALQGQPAVDYLKEHGLYNRLHESIETSQYELEQLPQSRLAGMGAAYQANNPAQHLQASFSSEQMLLEPVSCGGTRHWQAGLKLRGVGYGARLNAVTTGRLRASGNRVDIPHAALTEWYVNTSAGIEQGFTLDERPGVTFGGEPLRVAWALTGELKARLEDDGQAVILSRHNQQILRYDHLAAYDALGRALPARMEVSGAEIALLVEDLAAVYPVTIDPLFTQVKKLTASDGAAGDEYGVAVAVSGDTIAVGGYRNNTRRGAVYVYERNQGGADNWGEVKKLTASDAAASDFLGKSVAIQGDTIVAGAHLKNGLRGAAYIFERNQGGAGNWGEVKKLTASDAAASNLFGGSVAISSDTVVIGAIGANSGTGAAYLYQRNQGGANNWGEVKKLIASDAANNDSFGVAVGISGDTVVAGASFDNSGTGAAYLFARNQGGADNWGEVKKLTASDAPVSIDFGSAVSISGGTIAIGANATNSTTGAVYLYERNQGGPDNWGEIKILTASDGEEDDAFGISVGISGDTVVAGAQRFASNRPAGGGPPAGPGAAYIFERNQGGANNWGQVGQLTASDGVAGDHFGAAVGISAGTVVAGAYDHNSSTGAAYTFTRECGQWAEAQKQTASDAAEFDRFGNAAAISGDIAVVGAFLKGNSIGAAYIFGRNQGGADNWGQVKKLTASDAADFYQYGISVAINGDTVLIGANGKNQSRGAVYIYKRNQGGADNWGEVKILTASDAAVQDQFGHAVGIDDDTVVVGARGKNSFTGVVYIFNRNQGGADNWGEVKKFTASDAATDSEVGFSVGISADTVVAGAYRHSSNTGAAYIFERNQGGADNWGEVKKLTAGDATVNDFFGVSTGISGDTVVVGAFGKNSFTGAAYIFGRNQGGADNWGQVKKLTSSNSVTNERFGSSVGISVDTVVAGAPGSTSVTRPNGGPSNGPGAVYVFLRNQGGADNWGEAQKLTSSDGVVPDGLGIAVAIHNGTIAGGADGKNNSTGATYIFTPSCTKRSVKADFDGDGKTDLSVWRGNLFPAPWLIINSSDGSPQSIDWGTGLSPYNDVPVPGDYDGDGKADVAVWRSSEGNWYIKRSSDNAMQTTAWGLGAAPYNDVPVPGDYDGDGKTDIAIWRPGNGTWYIINSSDGSTRIEVWGQVGDTPVAADYDGDGKTDIAIWRGANTNWYIKQSSDGMVKITSWGAGYAPYFDVPVPADYDGDGKADLAVWRGTDTNWYIINSSNGQTQMVSWGSSASPYNDVPAPGDYDGDGKADVAIWRPLDGTWYVIRSSNGTSLIQQHGQSGDTPVPPKGVR